MREEGEFDSVSTHRLMVALDLCSMLVVIGFVVLLGGAFITKSLWVFFSVLITAGLVGLMRLGNDISIELKRRGAAK